MKILVDISSIRSGGGAQLALNFLDNISKTKFVEHDIYFLLPGSGPLLNVEKKDGFTYIPSPNGYFKRFLFSFTIRRYINKNDIKYVYTFFGPGLLHPKKTKSIITLAYPILCYPDSDFWKYLPNMEKISVLIMNQIRKKRIKHADVIIVETELMKKRLIENIGINNKIIIISPPVVSKYVNNHQKKKNSRNILLLSGLSIHKNIWRIYDVCELLWKENNETVRFHISANYNEYIKLMKKMRRHCEDKIINKYIVFHGVVRPDDIDSLYEQCDYAMNMSDLESFSNNYMEAWAAGIPLICSDRDFSRSICGGSAKYFEPHDIGSFYRIIRSIVGSEDEWDSYVNAGYRCLSLLPSFEKKYNDILDRAILQ